MEQFSKKFIITVIVILLPNLFAATLICFLRYRINSAENAVLNSKKELLLYEKRLFSNQDIKEVLSRTEDDRFLIKSTFVSDDSLVSFIKEVESLAEESNISLEIKKVVLVGTGQQKPSFTLLLKGNFSDIYRYLSLLENDKYRVIFDKVSLQKAGEENFWSANLEIRLLSFLNVL